jgi:hypothetical protein
MKPTRLRDLLAVAVVAGAVAYVLVSDFYLKLPPIPLVAPIAFVVLAGLELYLTATTRARLQGKPGTRPILPLVVARLAVLGKASAVVGALGLGVYAGFFGFIVGRLGTNGPSGDFPAAIFGMVASVVLVVAALLLERVCRVDQPPPGPDAREDRYDADRWTDDR